MSSNRSTHSRLLALQKKIHRSLQQQASRLLGEVPESIRRYEREYLDDFRRIPRNPRIVDKDHLIEDLRHHDVVLIGDYHTFAQAQRTALRILREAVRDGESWYLGLEMFASHRQEALDRFQLGQLSEKRFLEEIGYEDEWGFPWKQYAPTIHWAIRHRVKLIALNRPSELSRENGESELYERDRWAAGIITDLFQEARVARIKRPRMIVLYGEMHVGKRHLPTKIQKISVPVLKKSLKTLIIHQNHDSLYWRLAQQKRELEGQVIQLKRNTYCVLSSPPWAKWQSVINWAEGVIPSSVSSDDEIFEDSDDRDEIDPLSLMSQYAGILSEFFDLPKPSFDRLDVYTIRNADFTESIDRSKLGSVEMRLIRYHVLHHHRIYLPGTGIAYLAAPSENGAAEIASIHLLRSILASRPLTSVSRSKHSERMAALFYQWILENAFGFLGSLVLNPRRKCDLIDDHERRISELKQGADPVHPQELPARELAYLLLSAHCAPSSQAEAESQEALSEFLKSSKAIPALYFAARHVGFALAKHVHHSLLDEKITLSELTQLFLGQEDSPLTPPFWRFHSLMNAAFKGEVSTSKTESL